MFKLDCILCIISVVPQQADALIASEGLQQRCSGFDKTSHLHTLLIPV